MEPRKQQERNYHNLIRSDDVQSDPTRRGRYTSNRKYYSIHRRQIRTVESWWASKLPGKRALDYCCGNGASSVRMAGYGPEKVTGIDISDVSVENSRKLARDDGVEDRCEFQVMDAENMTFPDNTFDVVQERGVLHHLDLEKAYAEVARVLKPDGAFLCQEAVRHNPIIQCYRRMTPHLRTPWEVDHILGRKEIEMAKKRFHSVEILGLFHLTTLLAVPFRNTRLFHLLLSMLERVDAGLLKVPGLKWQAWSVVFVLSRPIKERKASG